MNIVKNIISILRQLKHYNRGSYFKYNGPRNDIINILGTGPSLQKTLSYFSANRKMGELFFAVNDFAKSDVYEQVCPSYYTFIDPAYWAEFTNEEDAINRDEVYRRINELTTWKLTIFIPVVFYKTRLLQNRITNTNITITPFNNVGFYPTKTPFYKSVLKNNFGIIPTGNVLGAALFLSINLGFQEIRVFGAEHSWTVDLRVNEKNQVCTIKRHFYQSDTEHLELVPWRDYDTHIFQMYEILQDLSHPFYGYLFLEWYATQMGCKIYNYTPGSFIDAFERRSFK